MAWKPFAALPTSCKSAAHAARSNRSVREVCKASRGLRARQPTSRVRSCPVCVLRLSPTVSPFAALLAQMCASGSVMLSRIGETVDPDAAGVAVIVHLGAVGMERR